MVQYGCCARFEFGTEWNVEFATHHGFDVLQIWYDRAGFGYGQHKHPLQQIARMTFPSIIHAVLEVHELADECVKLLEHLAILGHHRLIVHPFTHTAHTYRLGDVHRQLDGLLPSLEQSGITLYLENNCRISPVLYQAQEVAALFQAHPSLEFLCDVAHIDDYQHLAELIAAKHPAMLHVADSRFSVTHEHLPLGEGDIDFSHVFSHLLPAFDGTMIFEIVESDAHIVAAKAKMVAILAQHSVTLAS
jgi:sugar phosphate isomerase/epimerase